MSDSILKLALEQAPLILFALDPHGKLTLLAGGELKRLGLEPAKLIGTTPFQNKKLPLSKLHFKRALQGTAFSVTTQVKQTVYETYLAPLRDKTGKITGVVCLTSDVTARIDAEQALDAERAKATANQRLNALAEMASGIAHEVNNPLAILSGYSEQLSELVAISPLDLPRIQTITKKLQTTCRRIARIVEGLRNFSRDAGGDPFKWVRVKDVIDDTIELTQGMFSSAGIQLTCGGIQDDLIIQCRAVQISQVLFNLLTNSFDAVQKMPDPWVEIDVTDLGEQVSISVTDSGQGIPENIRNKILQPFFTTKEVGKGTGLGLSTAKGFVEAHRGTLALDERSAHTRFEIFLPKRQERAA